MSNVKPLYTYSFEEAKRNGEIQQWNESYEENVRCAAAILQSIDNHYNGYSLAHDAAKSVIEEFGYDRVFWVCANTVQQEIEDGRISSENKKWARSISIPTEKRNVYFKVDGRNGLLDIYLDEARQRYQELGLFDASHCEEDDTEQDYTGKVIVLRPEYLLGEYKTPEYQLFLADHGNGCRPHAIGRKVFGQFLKDGDETWYYRNEFIGVLKEEHLPTWTKEKLAQLQANESGSEPVM